MKLNRQINKIIIRHMTIIAMLVTGLFVFTASNSLVFAATTPVDNKAAICEGIGLAGSCAQPAGSTSVDSTIRLAISLLSFAVGIAAVIMIIVGGFKYIISSGDSNNINSAKNTILYAIIGLVVAVMAQVIVRYVLNQTK